MFAVAYDPTVARLRSSMFHPGRPGFTLIELLVVVGILGLLLGMLLPTLTGVREAANRTACLSNLRQVHHSFYLYAMDHRDQAPLGHRSASRQFNSMVYSTTAGGRWVLFGLLVQTGKIADPRVLYCPAERNDKFAYHTPDNPWPVPGVAPLVNIQAGYGARPEVEIPDDLSATPHGLVLPRLSRFRDRAIFADLTASRARVLRRHGDGINVLYGNGAARWVPLSVFDQPPAMWPEPWFPPTPAFNATHETIWRKLDQG